MTLLQMSFSAGMMILLFAIIRLKYVNKLPKVLFLIAWGLTLCRLLIPFSIPSAFSYQTLIKPHSKIISRNIIIPFGGNEPSIHKNAELFSTELADSGNNISIIMIVWLVGMLICTTMFLINYLRYRRDFSVSVPCDSYYIKTWLDTHKLRRKITVRVSDRIISPLTYGIRKPVILLPKKLDLENEGMLNNILLHEYTHIKHFDGITKLVLLITLSIHWFNPLVWFMCILANRDIELWCDESVLFSMDKTSRIGYAMTLLNMEEQKTHISLQSTYFCKYPLEERIHAIMKIKKYTAIGFIAAALFIGVTATVFATSRPIKVSNDVEDNNTVTLTFPGKKDAPSDSTGNLMSFTLDENMEGTVYEKLLDENTALDGFKEIYSLYEPFGLEVDLETGDLIYEGKIVRYSFDMKVPTTDEKLSMASSHGEIDLISIYDKDGELIGVRAASQEEYDATTIEMKEISKTVNDK